MNKHNQNGFTHIEAIIVVLTVVILLVIGIFIQRSEGRKGTNPSPSATANDCHYVTVSPSTVYTSASPKNTVSPTPYTTYICGSSTPTPSTSGTTAPLYTPSSSATKTPATSYSPGPSSSATVTPTPSNTFISGSSTPKPSTTISPSSSPN